VHPHPLPVVFDGREQDKAHLSAHQDLRFAIQRSRQEYWQEKKSSNAKNNNGLRKMANSEQTTISQEAMRDTVINMAVESWRFGRVFERMLTKLDAGEQGRYINQFRWFVKKIEDSLAQIELRIVNVEGHPFDPGIAATPLNIEDFDTKDILIVDHMLEPIIMGKEGVVKMGTVTLRKVGQ